MIEESDAARHRFVSQMTGRQWLNMCNYDIALDTSAMPLDDVVDLVAEYVRRRLPQSLAPVTAGGLSVP